MKWTIVTDMISVLGIAAFTLIRVKKMSLRITLSFSFRILIELRIVVYISFSIDYELSTVFDVFHLDYE